MNTIFLKYSFLKLHTHFSAQLAGEKMLKVPAFHKEILKRFQNSDRLQATIAPVGFAKSSCVKSFALTDLLNGEKFILYVSSTSSKVVDQFTALKKLLLNPLNTKLFGYEVTVNNEKEIVITIDGENRKIQGVASGEDILGINFEGVRPGLILIDDLEEQEQANSLARTQKLIDWVELTLIDRLPSVVEGRVRLIGTNLSKISFVNRLIQGDFAQWSVRVWKALDSTNTSIWEEKHPTEALIAKQHASPKSFAANYLNEPLDSSVSLVDDTDLRFYDSLPNLTGVYLHADTTHTGKQTSDYFALGAMGEGEKDKNYYLVDCVVRKCNVEEQARALILMYIKLKNDKRTGGVKKITYDEKANNGFEFWAKKLAKEEYEVSLPLQPLKYNKDKISHFEAHIPHFKANRVYLPQKHAYVAQVIQQVTQFPNKGVPDDAVDMLSGCLDNFHTVKKKHVMFTTAGIGTVRGV